MSFLVLTCLKGPFPWPLFGDIIALRRGMESNRRLEGYLMDRIKQYGGKERVVEVFFASIFDLALYFPYVYS